MTSTSESTVDIGPLTIAYNAELLQPRPWTAMQSRWAVELLTQSPSGRVLELCAGAGHIGLVTAAESGRSLVAVDLSSVACAFATANAARAGLADQVEVREAALDVAVTDGETFPVILADPPWVPSAEIGRFPDDPQLAIDGGPGGLDVARSCVAVAERHLMPGGSLLLQLGTHEQADLLVTADDHGLRDGGRREARDGDSGGVVLRLVAP